MLILKLKWLDKTVHQEDSHPPKKPVITFGIEKL